MTAARDVSEDHPTRPSPIPVIFSEEYYRDVVHEFGYDSFELERFAFAAAGMEAAELNTRFLCHHRCDAYLRAPRVSRIVTTGMGMSGPPHMGTVAQILAISRLQAAGERCQIVLGDLDAHNGKGRALGEATDLADRFARFCRSLGFDAGAGVIRSQYADLEPLRNQYLLSHYISDTDFAGAEEDNHGYYVSLGIIEQEMTFRRKASLVLMAADFVTLGQHFAAVLVMLGIDEHQYVRFTRDVMSRLDGQSTLRPDFTLSSLYTRLTCGFGGHPKMSKSIPGSSISVMSSPDEIASLLAGDEARNSGESPSYQLMCQLFRYPYAETIELIHECAGATARWRRAQRELVDFLVWVVEQW
jgi:tryptophanyl-tRNA synthetase